VPGRWSTNVRTRRSDLFTMAFFAAGALDATTGALDAIAARRRR
jgi:hypothetical protein